MASRKVSARVEVSATLRVLTLQQPYAEVVMQGLKTREYRSWPTSHRGTLLVHAGKSLCKEGLAHYGLDGKGLDRGAIVGAVEVIGMEWNKVQECLAWVLARPRRFGKPVPCLGQLGLWRLPEGLAGQVERLLRR
jgi:hypothetical protein